MGIYLDYVKTQKGVKKLLIFMTLTLLSSIALFILYFVSWTDLNRCGSDEIECGYYDRYCCKYANYSSCGGSGCKPRLAPRYGHDVGAIVFSSIFMVVTILYGICLYRGFQRYKKELQGGFLTDPQGLYASIREVQQNQ